MKTYIISPEIGYDLNSINATCNYLQILHPGLEITTEKDLNGKSMFLVEGDIPVNKIKELCQDIEFTSMRTVAIMPKSTPNGIQNRFENISI